MQPAPSPHSLFGRLLCNGFALSPGVLARRQIDGLIEALFQGELTLLSRKRSAFGGRNLLKVPAIKHLSESDPLRRLIQPVLGGQAKAVRALFFDKTAEANWPVLWHQDLSLAVAERSDLDGWGPWSIKAGVVHVQPPTSVLESMLTVRLHLDDCDEDNGPLKVVPGTHRLGRLSQNRIKAVRQSIGEVDCLAPAGAALIMRPLLLHASSPARAPRHRRVIHVEYAPGDILPAPLAWAA